MNEPPPRDDSLAARPAGSLRVVIHAAVARNDVIGHEGGMPWQLATDLRRFKALTMGKPVIMGRRTFESLGRTLPGRLNIVVTRDRSLAAGGAEIVYSLEDAFALAAVRARCMAGVPDEVCVIGGGMIYAQAIDVADSLCITHVEARPNGDAWFPPIDPAVWKVETTAHQPAGPGDSHAAVYTVYGRRDAVPEEGAAAG